MEFNSVVAGKKYQFAFLNKTTVLITGYNEEYILYKNKEWKCADEISQHLLEELGEAIESRSQITKIEY